LDKYLSILIFESVSLIDNDVLKGNIEENRLKILNENFVAGYENVELVDILVLLNIALEPDVVVEPLVAPELVPALD